MKTLTVCRASAGTGKTYTLASRYIALLMDGDNVFLFRNILAVTFTNKATAEMKQRILSYLYIIAEGDDGDTERSGFIQKVRSYMHNSVSKSDDDLRKKSREVYHEILEDYDNMKIVTIDSFLQTLVAGMAQAVGIATSFNVVLDKTHVISTAVDEIMTTHIDDDTQTKNLLTKYVIEQIGDEKGWDIRSSLIKMTNDVFKETVQSEDEQILNATTINSYRDAIVKAYSKTKAEMQKLYNSVCNCERDGEIDKGLHYYSMIRRVKESLENKASSKDLFKGLGTSDCKKLDDSNFLARINTQNPARASEVLSALRSMNKLCSEMRKKSLLYKITIEHLNDLMMMASVKNRISMNLEEANSILLARTASVLSKSLKPGDADFILEKAGIRFKHLMIDEFQDTSKLQWDVFRLLADEVLGSGGTVLVVGDIKQSIYRWRNGDYHIMENLGMSKNELGDYYDEKSEVLTRNFRSQANLMDFNLSLFKKITDLDNFQKFAKLYKEGKDGYSLERLDEFHNYGEAHNGYVQYMVFPYYAKKSKEVTEGQCDKKKAEVEKQITTQMFADINILLSKGARPADILILIKNKKEISHIIEAYHASGLEEKGVSLNSNDSFLLYNSESVLLMVAALKLIYNNDIISKNFLLANGKDVKRVLACDRRMPLYEMAEYIVNILFCDKDNQVCLEDVDYVNSFLDKLRTYVGSYGADGRDFLSVWDDELHKSSIPAANTDGIRIMTIHSAKGLEARHVFVPFCSWMLSSETHDTKLWVKPKGDTGETIVKAPVKIPVTFKSQMKDTAYETDYNAEVDAQEVDNLNVLYVALTRAADNLFIYSWLNYKSLKANPYATVGDLIFGCLANEKVASGKALEEELKEVWDKSQKDLPAYAKYCMGELYIRPPKQSKADSGASPFEYNCSDDEVTNLHYYSTRGNISFRQSQESMLYNPNDENNQRQSRIDAGILRHNILAEIKTKDDAAKVVDRFYTKGLIENKNAASEIFNELNAAWTKWPQMADWFGGGWKLLREVTLVCPPDKANGFECNTEMRPDRVMIKGSKAVVLDFKFGKHNHSKYSQQVVGYVGVLRLMGYDDVEGWLWYGFDNELVKVC